MAAPFLPVIGTALMAMAGGLGVVAVQQALADAGVAGGDEVQFVRCAGVRQEFTHAPHPAQPAQPVWVLRRKPTEAPASCGDNGSPFVGPGLAEPDWLERRPGVVGLPRLLV
ncbi:hypothetical protein OOT46_16275 [Aquabacterium sp. A7-Y]|uniref:hypothetical protein n=1 Tax=Aquabacterium sp. A7-Y TaxID=1349605 RepID=UPI00223D95DE|nr:hypothetical protein [Aquabacterium sp. A7-Y]MCW7539400.1 hypothetical protein [Aquabacterium sp. A7-Y]